MDLSGARVVLRQRSVLDVLDLAVRFLAVHAGPYARLSALVIAPSCLLSWAVAGAEGWAAGWAVSILLGLLAEGPFTVLAGRLVFEREVRISGILRAATRAAPRLLLIRVVQLTLVVTGLFFFVFPGLWIGVSLLFVSEVSILERASLGVSVARARRVTSGQSGRPVAAALALLVLQATATLLGDLVGRFVVGDLLQFREPPPLWTAGGSPLALVGFWLFVPYAATARFFAYLDLRTRAEGWDVQTRFAAIALRSLSAPRKAA